MSRADSSAPEDRLARAVRRGGRRDPRGLRELLRGRSTGGPDGGGIDPGARRSVASGRGAQAGPRRSTWQQDRSARSAVRMIAGVLSLGVLDLLLLVPLGMTAIGCVLGLVFALGVVLFGGYLLVTGPFDAPVGGPAAAILRGVGIVSAGVAGLSASSLLGLGVAHALAWYARAHPRCSAVSVQARRFTGRRVVKTVRTLLLVTAVGTGVSASSWTLAQALSQRDPRRLSVTREFPWDRRRRPDRRRTRRRALHPGGRARKGRGHRKPAIGRLAPRRGRRPRRPEVENGGAAADRRDRAEGHPLFRQGPRHPQHRGLRSGRAAHRDDGRAEVKAAGRAGTVRLDLRGSGWADLSQLQAEGTEVVLSASRSAIVGPTSSAKVSGGGLVVLLSQPEAVELDLQGAGRLIRAEELRARRLSTAFPRTRR